MAVVYLDKKYSVQTLKAADNETLTGTGVDMSGYEGVDFYVVALEGEALSFSIKAQQDSDAAFGTAADLLGTATTFTTTIPAKGEAVLRIHQPAERYVRPIITVPNANTATPVACVAVQYGARVLPYAQALGELHVSPAEGTA